MITKLSKFKTHHDSRPPTEVFFLVVLGEFDKNRRWERARSTIAKN